MKYLLDTNVIAELVAKQPSPNVIAWIERLEESQLYLSVITVGEIKKGIEKLPESQRKRDLHYWLTNELLLRFQGRILVIDSSVAQTWGVLTATLELRGRTLPSIDSLIAAIALHGQLTLATRNVADFAGAGVTVINPWI
jgi:tRNA(fMet)-specific endonuclease VapC